MLARELENEGYRRWLAGRDTAPPGWRDEAFSTVLHLTPEELTEVAAAIRAVIAPYSRARHGAGAATSGLPVGVVARMFPLLPAGRPEPPVHARAGFPQVAAVSRPDQTAGEPGAGTRISDRRPG